MCMKIDRYDPKIATEDIVCYKLACQLTEGEYITPYMYYPLEIGKELVPSEKVEYDLYSMDVSDGWIHSYLDLACAIDGECDCVVIKSIIPKGATYLLGSENSEIASDCLIPKELILDLDNTVISKMSNNNKFKALHTISVKSNIKVFDVVELRGDELHSLYGRFSYGKGKIKPHFEIGNVNTWDDFTALPYLPKLQSEECESFISDKDIPIYYIHGVSEDLSKDVVYYTGFDKDFIDSSIWIAKNFFNGKVVYVTDVFVGFLNKDTPKKTVSYFLCNGGTIESAVIPSGSPVWIDGDMILSNRIKFI